MKYKLICSDLDDTLIDSKRQFGKNLKESISRYVSLGGKFCIVTGRMTQGALPIAKELGLKGEIITYQGAAITDIESGEEYYKAFVSVEDAVEIGKYLESKGYYYQIYIDGYVYTEKACSFTELYATISHAEFVQTGVKLTEYIPAKNIRTPKLLVLEDPSRIPEILAELKEKFGDKFLINTSKPFIAEIIPKGVSKGGSVKFVADKYGIKQEEIICVGDSENDVTMLDFAGLGVCVGSGSEVAKLHANVIAPDLDHDPVSWVIERYCLAK